MNLSFPPTGRKTKTKTVAVTNPSKDSGLLSQPKRKQIQEGPIAHRPPHTHISPKLSNSFFPMRALLAAAPGGTRSHTLGPGQVLTSSGSGPPARPGGMREAWAKRISRRSHTSPPRSGLPSHTQSPLQVTPGPPALAPRRPAGSLPGICQGLAPKHLAKWPLPLPTLSALRPLPPPPFPCLGR